MTWGWRTTTTRFRPAGTKTLTFGSALYRLRAGRRYIRAKGNGVYDRLPPDLIPSSLMTLSRSARTISSSCASCSSFSTDIIRYRLSR